jgi:hypothetical protein
MGLRGTGSPPLSGCARLAWFPDGYRVFGLSLSVGPSTKPRESGPPASILGLPDSGGALAHEGQARSADYLQNNRVDDTKRGNHARRAHALLYVVFEGKWGHTTDWPGSENLSYHLCESQGDRHPIGKNARIIVQLGKGQNIR